MQIGLTGATGFLGQRLLPLLSDHQLRVVTLAKESLESTRIISADLVSESPAQDFYHELDVLVHMVGSFSTNPQTLVDINIATLMNVLKPLETLAPKPHIIFTSSCAVYGETPEGKSSVETDPANPSTPYGFAKAWAEQYLAWHSKRYGYTTTILRFPNIYGKGSQAVIAKILERIAANQPVIIEGDGQQVRDFLFVDDAATGITKSIEAKKAGVFNISTGTEMTIRGLVDVLAQATKTQPTIEQRPTNSFTQRRTVLDPSKALAELDWQADTTLTDGLAAILHG